MIVDMLVIEPFQRIFKKCVIYLAKYDDSEVGQVPRNWVRLGLILTAA